MVKISVPVAIWGDAYQRFIPRWWDGIESLERLPDEIVIVTASDSKKAMSQAIPKRLHSKTNLIVSDKEHFSDYWNLAFDSCSGDWIAGCAIDDWFLPCRLNEIDAADEAGCELICESVLLHPSGKVFEGRWDANEIFTTLTMPGNGPMKRTLYDRLGGFDGDIYFADWAFYMKAAAAGVSVYSTTAQNWVFDEGVDHLTWSGTLQSPEKISAAHEQIRQFARRIRR